MMAQMVWVAQAAQKRSQLAIPSGEISRDPQRRSGGMRPRDGVKDGVIEDPTKCKFDPKVMPARPAKVRPA